MKRIPGLLMTLCLNCGCAAVAVAASTATVIDSTEAAKVSAWLRSAPPADNSTSHFSVIGVQNFNGIGPNAEDVLSKQGPAAFYQNAPATQEARNTINTKVARFGPVMQAGGIAAYRDVANLPWGMIEPAKGDYNFSLLDLLVQGYQTWGIDYVGVAMPFASWDLASHPPAATVCQHFFTEDYKYLAYGGRMDRYVDLAAFTTMLQKAVERYDGDGIDDMTGLTRTVKYWQIQNEPEGADCGQFRNDASAFFELMRSSHNAVKAACPDCQVLNGGAGLVDKSKQGGSFWWDYANLGGKAYIDIVALHFNDGKSPGTQDVSLLETSLANVKNALGVDKPIWLTEFGVMIDIPPGGFVSLTETQAASWYTRFYAAGLNSGAKRFFSDAQSFFSITTGNNVTRLLPYYTNKLLEAKLGNFTASKKLANGQYRFIVNGKAVYVLWSGIPAELKGSVSAYDLYGTESIVDAGNLRPTQEWPLLVVSNIVPTQSGGAGIFMLLLE